MNTQDWLLPLIFVLSAMPVFVLAGMIGRGNLQLINGLDPAKLRDPGLLARKLARLLAATGFAVVLGGAGLLWAGTDTTRITGVVLAMVVAVNGLAITLIVSVIRAKRDGNPTRRE